MGQLWMIIAGRYHPDHPRAKSTRLPGSPAYDWPDPVHPLFDWDFYAKYEPDNNITLLLAPHFADRLADQPWIIHDIRRGIAALYNGQEWILTDTVPAALAAWTDCDDIFEDIWRTYHQHIAIAERTNSHLQKNLMPMRYWKHLTEFTR